MKSERFQRRRLQASGVKPDDRLTQMVQQARRSFSWSEMCMNYLRMPQISSWSLLIYFLHDPIFKNLLKTPISLRNLEIPNSLQIGTWKISHFHPGLWYRLRKVPRFADPEKKHDTLLLCPLLVDSVGDYPRGLCQQFAIENGHWLLIVDLPINSYVKLPEGILTKLSIINHQWPFSRLEFSKVVLVYQRVY